MDQILPTSLIELCEGDVRDIKPLGGGCVGEVYQLKTPRFGLCVAKVGGKGSRLDEEGAMLRDLKQTHVVPVPEVFVAEDRLLVMEALPNGDPLTQKAEDHCADLIAALHQIRKPYCGYERPTLIAAMKQPNPRCSSWLEFYRDHRLYHMTQEAIDAARLAPEMMDRIIQLGQKLTEIAPDQSFGSLLHGDFWGGNILISKDRMTGLVDPALYYGNQEMDIAFSTLFHTFSPRFYERYQEHHPLDKGFFSERTDLYNLYPVLVHVRLFGGAYVLDVDRILRKFGC